MNYISKGYYISSFIYLIEGKLYCMDENSDHILRAIASPPPF